MFLWRGVAQSGSALVLGTRGRWFEPSHPDHGIFRTISKLSQNSLHLADLANPHQYPFLSAFILR